jgi:hypothetical protein
MRRDEHEPVGAQAHRLGQAAILGAEDVPAILRVLEGHERLRRR